MRNSYDSGQRPLTDVQYTKANNPTSPHPYSQEYDPYSYSANYLPAQPAKKPVSKWIKFGIPAALVIIAAAIVGIVIGVRHHSSSSGGGSAASSSTGGGGGKGSGTGPVNALDIYPVATNSWFLPVYPSATNQALFTTPTFVPASSAKVAWPADPYSFANPQPTAVRPDHPRIHAPQYKWDALPSLVGVDPYIAAYHKQVLVNASIYYPLPVVPQVVDGSSGTLDSARQIKERIKAFAYAYRTTNQTKWVDRAWEELQNAANNGTTPFGTAPDIWYSTHFLDTAEYTQAFAIAYDWLFDVWQPNQREAIMWSIINLGLSRGITAYANKGNGWWTGQDGTVISGNWNCVCNGGMTIGALAIITEDPTGIAAQILAQSIPNAQKNCVFGPSSDGTWTETANYWYFGTTGHAEMTSALQTASGSDFGLLNTNPNFQLTGLFHMYSWGMTSLFNFGDHGPNKYSSTANSMLFYASAYNLPAYMLFQRDMFDAWSDPWAVLWYDPTAEGAWWDSLALDHFFNDPETYWASMRSSWTDDTGVYIAMKSSKLTGHQTHGDLDCGDFVLDALGTRWAGELGSGDYNSLNYFSNETDASARWFYYRKRTEGQNTILLNAANQDAQGAAPTAQFGTTNETQGSSTVLTLPQSSTAYFTTDMSSAYTGQSTGSVLRGIRMINGRKQVLLQDDITTTEPIMWRMHTNATVTIGSGGTTATLSLDGKTMQVSILNAPSGAVFTTMQAVPLSTDPPLPDGYTNQPNPGVTVLVISFTPSGPVSLQVLFNPQWSGMDASSFVTPSAVAIGQWSTTSHP